MLYSVACNVYENGVECMAPNRKYIDTEQKILEVEEDVWHNWRKLNITNRGLRIYICI